MYEFFAKHTFRHSGRKGGAVQVGHKCAFSKVVTRTTKSLRSNNESQDTLENNLVENQALACIAPVNDMLTSENVGSITISTTDEASTVLWAMECGSLRSEEACTSPVFSLFDGAFYFVVTVDAMRTIAISLKALRCVRELSADFFAVHPVSGDVVASRHVSNLASVSNGSSVPLCGIEVSSGLSRAPFDMVIQEVMSEANSTIFLGARMKLLSM